MAAALVGDDLSRTTSSGRSWRSQSIRDVWQGQPDVFARSSTRRQEVDDEEELKWAAIERLPTYDRLRKGMMMTQVMSNGRVIRNEVDVTKLGAQDKKQLMESILKVVEDDNEKFLRRLRDRTDRVGVEIPKIEVRFQNLSIEGDAYVGTRALPTLLNSTLNTIEGILGMIHLSPSKKRVIKILQDVSGIIKPSRMALLLGPPGSGKTTLLQALTGKLDDDLKVTGQITYCGHEFKEFVPQRTCAYISQHDLHYGEMTVRETMDFSGRCLGVGTRYEMLAELSRREKEAGIKPDPEIDAFMKATAMAGQETSLITDYVLKILGLDICADIMVGDDMRRGISGGQKKRVTTGEMLVGPAKAFFMDEISTGLDSSTTFQIVKFMRQMVHIMDVTMVISLLQPAPETFDLFDDVILLSDGQIVYQGPRENVLEFFEYMGFKCPDRKGIADFLQEVTSKKDQEQYWFKKNQPYQYVSVPELARAFNSFHVGQRISVELRVPYDKSRAHPAALVKEKYGISNWDLFKACFAREWLLMKRNSFVYIFKTFQITIMAIIALTVFFRTEMNAGQVSDSGKFLGALFFSLINVMFNGMAELPMTIVRLPVFFKQRDFLFYPAWAFALPIWVLRLPISLMESLIWVILTYYTIGFAPAASRFFKQLLAFFGVHQMALSLFRFLAAVGRTQVVANTLGTFTLLIVFVLGGFIVSRDYIEDWMIWGYYLSPMTYGQNAIAINEFLSERWSAPTNGSQPTVGTTILRQRGLYTTETWYWISVGLLFAFSLLFNVLFIAALTYLNPLGDSKATSTEEEDDSKKGRRQITANGEGVQMAARNAGGSTSSAVENGNEGSRKGMVLPFKPLSLAFNHVNYYVDMPAEMKTQGVDEDRLQLLRDVSGAFRPGVLTALVGVSGAGKTTLMDVLAGRKTGGYIEGSITISGYPKNQETFARVSGYCEQNDIHSPYGLELPPALVETSSLNSRKTPMAAPSAEILPPSLDSTSEPPPLFDGTTKLYINYQCPFAQRAWITRNYKGLQGKIKLIPIDLQNRPAWYKEKVYPENKVPSLEHNNKVTGESLDLIKYVDTHFEGPKLLPDDPNKKQFAEELLSYSDTFNKIVYSSFKGDPAKETSGAFDHLETALQKFNDGPFFLGQLSLVDFAYIPFVERFQIFFGDVFKYDITAGRPNLVKWIEALNKIDAYKQTKCDPKQVVEIYKTRFMG